jgi:adenylate cyclase class IV
MNEQNGQFIEIESKKKTDTEILELKSTVTEIKNSLESFNS